MGNDKVGRMELSGRFSNFSKMPIRLATMSAYLCKLVFDESGQDLIEYALVGAVVALGVVASMRSLAEAIRTAFGGVGSSVTAAV